MAYKRTFDSSRLIVPSSAVNQVEAGDTLLQAVGIVFDQLALNCHAVVVPKRSVYKYLNQKENDGTREDGFAYQMFGSATRVFDSEQLVVLDKR